MPFSEIKSDRINNQVNYKLNLRFLRRFYNLQHVIFPKWPSVTVILFAFLLCVALLEQIVVYQVGILASKYYKALGDKDREAFKDTTLFALILIVVIAFVKATNSYTSSVFYVKSRELVTKHLHESYFKDVLYYSLNVLDDTVDNPDQRITQDVNKMCLTYSQIVARLLISPFTIGYYLYETWINTGWIGPVGVLAFFILSTVINKFLMSPVVALVYKQENLEGDFRFKHMQIRSHAEAGAFCRCGQTELIKSNQKLDKLMKTQQRLMMKEYILNFAVNTADYLGSILSYVILAIPIFVGVYDDLSPTDLSSLISKNSFYIMYLINQFTQLIDMAGQMTDVAGTTHRIGQLLETLHVLEADTLTDTIDTLKKGDGGDTENHPEVGELLETMGDLESDTLVDALDESDGACGGTVNIDVSVSNSSLDPTGLAYTVENLSYGPPSSDKLLVKNLTMQLVAGVNVLVTGNSGCGKSSFLRVLDGLWPAANGEISRKVLHGHRGILYLPQRPFLTDGTLREQIIFPYLENGHQGIDDQEIMNHLNDAGLDQLYDRIGGLDVPVDWNWYDMLSPGEMQRISFVRLFYHRPPFAVLDEATSQLGFQMEKKLYERCRDLQMTLISVAHRNSLRPLHQMELHLDGKGNWTFQPITQPLPC